MQLVDDGVLEPELVGIERTCGLEVDEASTVSPSHARQRKSKAGSCSGSMRSRTPPHSIAMRSPVTRFSMAATRRRAPSAADLDVAEMKPELARPVLAQRDRDRHRIVAGGRFLDKADDLGVVERWQSAGWRSAARPDWPPQPVELADIVLDVAGLVPVAHLELVFLGIQIFLLARDRLVLEQLEAVVDAVIARQRRGERDARLEHPGLAALQVERQDVGRVDEEVGAEIFALRIAA